MESNVKENGKKSKPTATEMRGEAAILLKEQADQLKKRLQHTGMNKAIVFFGVILLGLWTVVRLFREEVLVLSPAVASLFSLIILISGIYLVASLFLRLTVTKVTRAIADLEIEQRILVSKTYTFLIYLVATVYLLWRFGVTLSNITIFLGLATTGIAFAVRDILMSYFAWYMLLTKKPFRIGDHIRIGDEEGQVKHIGTFYVLLDDTPERYEDFIRIPNRLFLEKPIINYGRKEFRFRIRIPLGSIKDLPKGFERRLTKAKDAATRPAGPPLTFLLDADKERVVLEIKGYATSYAERDATRDAVLKAVLAAMR